MKYNIQTRAILSNEAVKTVFADFEMSFLLKYFLISFSIYLQLQFIFY